MKEDEGTWMQMKADKADEGRWGGQMKTYEGRLMQMKAN